jgi:hypothetical protein
LVAETVKEEAQRKDVGFPDLHATGEVDLPAARSGEAGHSGFPVCFAMLRHCLKPVRLFRPSDITGRAPLVLCASQMERWAAANQRAADTLLQVERRWFPGVAVIT